MIQEITKALEAVTEAVNAYSQATEDAASAADAQSRAQSALIEATEAADLANQDAANALDALRQTVDNLDATINPPIQPKTAPQSRRTATRPRR